MALVIDTDTCTGCRICASVCPEGAISFNEESFSLVIDPNLCTECRDCQSTCPAASIQDPG